MTLLTHMYILSSVKASLQSIYPISDCATTRFPSTADPLTLPYVPICTLIIPSHIYHTPLPITPFYLFITCHNQVFPISKHFLSNSYGTSPSISPMPHRQALIHPQHHLFLFLFLSLSPSDCLINFPSSSYWIVKHCLKALSFSYTLTFQLTHNHFPWFHSLSQLRGLCLASYSETLLVLVPHEMCV